MQSWRRPRGKKCVVLLKMKGKSDCARLPRLSVPASSPPLRPPPRHSGSRSFRIKVSTLERNEPMICSLVLANKKNPSRGEAPFDLLSLSSPKETLLRDGIKPGLPSSGELVPVRDHKRIFQKKKKKTTRKPASVLKICRCVGTKPAVLGAQRGQRWTEPQTAAAITRLTTHAQLHACTL